LKTGRCGKKPEWALIAAAFIREQPLADFLGGLALRIGRRIVDDLATKSRNGGDLVGVLQDRSHDLLHKNIAHHKG
jgi:hypothetical protein